MTEKPAPSGDLRDQIREALTLEHYRRASERIEASPEEHAAAFADVVMHVIEPAMLAVTVDATQRADLLAGRLQEALDAVAAERQVTEQLIEQVLIPERARCKEATERAETAERLAAFYRQQIDAPADLLARVDAAEAAITEKDAEIRQLRRQVMGYRGMKDVYLTERNEAYRELIKDENLIERLCDDREAGQSMAKAALTEQRERAEQAERERDEYRERFTNQMTAGSELVEKLQQAEAAVQRARDLADRIRNDLAQADETANPENTWYGYVALDDVRALAAAVLDQPEAPDA